MHREDALERAPRREQQPARHELARVVAAPASADHASDAAAAANPALAALARSESLDQQARRVVARVARRQGIVEDLSGALVRARA